MATVNGTHVITNKALFNYVHLLEPMVPMNGGDPVYSVCLIIPKSDTETVDAINEAIDNALHENVDKFGGKIPNKKAIRTPLRDGDIDREGNEQYANCWFINTKSKFKPHVVDRQKNELNSDDDVYSGMYGRASLNFYAYSVSGNRGVACGLGDVQKLEDGERMTRRTGVDAFDDLDNGDGKLPF